MDMKLEDLVPLTNGLSVTAGPHTLVCDRARLTPVGDDAVDMAFLIAGTDYVPRLRLTRERVARGTADELSRIVRRVARGAVTGEWRG
jgi:hypothetical protein